jgi:hypothetical protein
MGLSNRKVNPDSHIARRDYEITLPVAPTASQTGKAFWRHIPGFPFRVVGVRLYCTTNTNLTNVDVQIGTTSVLASTIAPTNDTTVAGTLSSTLANTLGLLATSQISLLYTTGTGPAIENGVLTVIIRPYPIGGYQ